MVSSILSRARSQISGAFYDLVSVIEGSFGAPSADNSSLKDPATNETSSRGSDLYNSTILLIYPRLALMQQVCFWTTTFLVEIGLYCGKNDQQIATACGPNVGE